MSRKNNNRSILISFQSAVHKMFRLSHTRHYSSGKSTISFTLPSIFQNFCSFHGPGIYGMYFSDILHFRNGSKIVIGYCVVYWSASDFDVQRVSDIDGMNAPLNADTDYLLASLSRITRKETLVTERRRPSACIDQTPNTAEHEVLVEREVELETIHGGGKSDVALDGRIN